MSYSVWPQRWQPTRLPHPWDSPGKNTGAGCHALLHFRAVGKESETCKRYSMLESTGVPRRVKERKNKVCGEWGECCFSSVKQVCIRRWLWAKIWWRRSKQREPQKEKKFQVQGMPTSKAPGVIQKLTRCSACLHLHRDNYFDDNIFRTLLT